MIDRLKEGARVIKRDVCLPMAYSMPIRQREFGIFLQEL
jgi:hypothetical protein